MIIRPYQETDRQAWDGYVYQHPDAYHAHLAGWKDVIEQTYKKKSYYLVAEKDLKIVGVLPLFHIKSRLFGNTLVSMPYLTYGGILANNDTIIEKLLDEALEMADDLNAVLELRHVKPLSEELYDSEKTQINDSKVSMRLELPQSSEELFNSFKAKLRSQIRRPQKEGMIFKLGGPELIKDFYRVFTVNMRDLGSPVHSKKLFENIFKYMDNTVRIGIVYYNHKAVGAGIISLFKYFVEIPWASTLKKYNKFSPNMLLYWSFLEYTTNNGFKYFDFGRSKSGEGTYKFKKQWGSIEYNLKWFYFYNNDKNYANTSVEAKKSIKLMISLWSKLPLKFSNVLGPILRKQVSL